MGTVSSYVLPLLFNNIAVIVVVIFTSVIYLSTRNHDYFQKRGVVYEKPWPLVGNLLNCVLRKVSYAIQYKATYDRNPNESLVGIFEFIKPTFMIRDPEMIKQICIKEFDSFVNHRNSIDPDADPIFGRSLISIKDQRWKDMRSIMSPAFSGSKMRYMYDLFRDCAKNAFDYIEKTSGGNSYEFEAKDLFSRLSNDIIATSVFGMEVNSIKDRENAFYKNVRVLTDFNAVIAIKFFMALIFPKFLNALKIPLLDKESSHYFRNIILDSMILREKSGSARPDMIQLLLQTKAKLAQENKKGQVTDDDFVAQSVLFFLAGFNTAATLFSFMAYELALNKEIQDKLCQEVDDFISNAGGRQPTYEDIHKMTYLDMVVQESLRKWPPGILTDRECNKQTTIQDSDGKDFTFYPGDSIVLPVFAMQRDAKHFANPEKFDPERFSNENKDNINQFTYIPFGLGPRQCIGYRFSLMECKLLFFNVLSKFRIATSAKTEIPLQLKMGVFLNESKNGIWLSLKPRK